MILFTIYLLLLMSDCIDPPLSRWSSRHEWSSSISRLISQIQHEGNCFHWKACLTCFKTYFIHNWIIACLDDSSLITPAGAGLSLLAPLPPVVPRSLMYPEQICLVSTQQTLGQQTAFMSPNQESIIVWLPASQWIIQKMKLTMLPRLVSLHLQLVLQIDTEGVCLSPLAEDVCIPGKCVQK